MHTKTTMQWEIFLKVSRVYEGIQEGCVEPHISHSAIFHTVKNWYKFFTAREEMVPIRHIFHTNISHFVKFAHVVKLYVANMRNLHIDKKHPKSAAFCNRFQFITFYNVVQTD